MPDTVLVNTTNTTLEKRWPFPQGGHSLGRRKNAYHKISAMGEKDALLMVQKWRGLVLTFEVSVDTAHVQMWNSV